VIERGIGEYCDGTEGQRVLNRRSLRQRRGKTELGGCREWVDNQILEIRENRIRDNMLGKEFALFPLL
jgi:hypothetical protein